MRRFKINPLRLLAHVGALLPLAWLIWDGWHGQLTFNPIREITLRTGKSALVLLVLSLACTPGGALLGLPQIKGLRRPLGLYAFLYASLHFLTFVGLDYRFDLELIRQDLLEKRFALIGFTAFLILLPLAITSTQGWKQRLGQNWKRLHRFVYLAALLAVLHFAWQAKGDIREALLYGVVVLALLITRLPVVGKALNQRKGGGTAEASK